MSNEPAAETRKRNPSNYWVFESHQSVEAPDDESAWKLISKGHESRTAARESIKAQEGRFYLITPVSEAPKKAVVQTSVLFE